MHANSHDIVDSYGATLLMVLIQKNSSCVSNSAYINIVLRYVSTLW